MEPIIIKRNKKLFYRMLTIGGISLFFLLRSIVNYHLSEGEGNLIFLILAYIFGFFMLTLVINSLRQLFNKKPALIISDEGIIDNISLIRSDLVPWSNIVDADIKKYKGVLQLIIYLRDYYAVLDNDSPYRYKMTQSYINQLETPWVINLGLIISDIPELHRIILEKSSVSSN